MSTYRAKVALPMLALVVVLAPPQRTPPGPPTPHSVTLTWKEPNLPAKALVAGYNIYRWTKKDSKHLRIATQVPGPPYVDRQVASGETYFYAVTVIDQNGGESRSSENIQATIP